MGLKAKDELYRLYSEHQFKDLIIDPETDPALYKFVNDTIEKGPKFSNYSPEQVEHFVSRIYELRKNNSNNPAR